MSYLIASSSFLRGVHRLDVQSKMNLFAEIPVIYTKIFSVSITIFVYFLFFFK